MKYQPAVYSPAYEATEYIPIVFNNRFDNELSPYQGWPTDDLDALWQDLYRKGASLRVVQEWASEHYVDVQSMRAHVEDGYVLNYTHFHQFAMKPEDKKVPI
ncbi:hypothetical protein ARSEF1564_003008, partial [Beauveria bassiana]